MPEYDCYAGLANFSRRCRSVAGTISFRGSGFDLPSSNTADIDMEMAEKSVPRLRRAQLSCHGGVYGRRAPPQVKPTE
jgi:hypothetical protein